MELKPITAILTINEYHGTVVIFQIDNSVSVCIKGSMEQLKEIKSDFESFSPMEQRAHLNAVLFERLSK